MGRKKLNALILLDAQDYQVLGKVQQAQCEWMNTVLKVIDYRQLNSLIPELQRIVAENRIDLVLYSRNDQVFERINIGHITAELRVGYSSFSGIDTGQANEQRKQNSGARHSNFVPEILVLGESFKVVDERF